MDNKERQPPKPAASLTQVGIQDLEVKRLTDELEQRDLYVLNVGSLENGFLETEGKGTWKKLRIEIDSWKGRIESPWIISEEIKMKGAEENIIVMNNFGRCNPKSG